MNPIFKLCAVFLLTLGVQACGTPGGGEPQVHPGKSGDFMPAIIGIPTDSTPERAYQIGPHDLLKIAVYQVEDLSTEARVSEKGIIVMPLIGNVQVSGLTPREAEQLIARRLGERYLNDPKVNILIAESAAQNVTVIGEVKNPDVYPLVGETTLMQALALAGGLTDVAKKREIVLFRKKNKKDVDAYVINLASIETGELADPVVLSNDRIVVPKSGFAVTKRTAGRVLTGWVLRPPWFY